MSNKTGEFVRAKIMLKVANCNVYLIGCKAIQQTLNNFQHSYVTLRACVCMSMCTSAVFLMSEHRRMFGWRASDCWLIAEGMEREWRHLPCTEPIRQQVSVIFNLFLLFADVSYKTGWYYVFSVFGIDFQSVYWPTRIGWSHFQRGKM